MPEPTRVMAVGTVMVDVLAVGLPNVAEPGQVIYAPGEIESHIGGHPVDVAIDLAELGYPAGAIGLVAAVGDGMYGSYVTDVIERYGFATYLQRVEGHDTGRNLVLAVTGEDRRFHLDPGANWHLDPSHVAAALRDFAPAVVTLRPGYTGIDHHLPELLGGLEGTAVMLDVMHPHPSRPVDLVLAVLPHVDIVHCNHHEAMAVTGEQTVEAAVANLLERGPAMVLLTSGGSGAWAVTDSLSVTQPGFEIEVVDATGCGDAFCAGVIHWLVGRYAPPTRAALTGLGPNDLAQLLAHAQSVGAAAGTAAGCVEGVKRPTVEAIRAAQLDRVVGASLVAKR